MPEWLVPGVYVEEIPQGPRPIEGVPTSTAAFVGETERGPIRPLLVTSAGEYGRRFGDTSRAGQHLPAAVDGFFINGGRRLYVCRVVGANAQTANRSFGSFTLRANGAGDWGNRVWAALGPASTHSADGQPAGLRLKVAYWADVPAGFEAFDPFDPASAGRAPQPALIEEFDDIAPPRWPSIAEQSALVAFDGARRRLARGRRRRFPRWRR